MILAAPVTSRFSAVTGALLRIWYEGGLGGRIAAICAVAGLVIALIWYLVRLALKRGGGNLLRWLTGANLALFVGLTFQVSRLPELRGSAFILWHQVVRVSAAITGTGFVVCFMILAVPWVMDRFEGRGFVSLVAARHVRAQKSGFLTVISVLSIAGVGVSSFALCAVVAIMGGFGADLKHKILGNNAHVKIEAKRVGGFDHWSDLLEQVRLVKGVQAATPVASGEAMASSSSNTAGVILRGIDTVTIGTVIDLLQNIEVGKFSYLDDPKKLANLPPDEPIGIGSGGEYYLKGPDIKPYVSKLDPDVSDATIPPDTLPGVVIGRELAKSLHVYVGDDLTLISPLGDLGPMGVLPRSRKFRVAAIFYSGMYEYDASHAYVKIDAAQDFFDLKQNVTGIEIKLDNAERVAEVRPAIEALVKDRDDVRVRDWKELNKNLFSALELEKIATFIILSLAILVASFCIICTLLLMVTEKSKEIAILKSLGASDNAILKIFMSEGVMIGGIGTIFGVTTGLAVTLGLKWFGVRLDPDVYYVDKLPINVEWSDFTLVALAALVITTIATIYPAVAASRLRPVDGIRYE
ncbi:MAG TPA: ABC transporter permease [Polyangiaceae bacterium]|jgi:lipoprotein-releasing system permease protein|nr:ABC transporter permease [Polyangiaceae bacterium]